MKVGLVLHGDAPSPRDLARLDGCDAVVCADGGANAVVRAGRVPTWVVGDLDSIDDRVRALVEAGRVQVARFPRAKDETDGERALDKVFDLGASEVLILGGHGGRTAMALANLQLLRRCQLRGVPAWMVDRGEELRFLGPGESLRVAGRRGSGLDLLPWDGEAMVSLEGVDWPLRKERLGAQSARGVSNRVAAEDALVAVHEGTALLVLEAEALEAFA